MKTSEILNMSQLLSDRSRLAIMAFLSANGASDFNALLEGLELTRGNLSAHAKKLEDAGYIKVVKEFVERKPRTTYSCTAKGKSELKGYLRQIEEVLKGLS